MNVYAHFLETSDRDAAETLGKILDDARSKAKRPTRSSPKEPHVYDAGFELVATFRSPHVTIAFSESPEIAMTRMLAVPHQRFMNTAYREDDR